MSAFLIHRGLCALLPIFAFGTLTQGAEIIYSHDFNGDGTGLDGTPVDIGTGEWMAAVAITRNGAFSTNPGSATLPFVPQDGFFYSLDARLTGVVGDSDWVGLGFANGQSVNANTNSRFITGQVVGTAWMLVRGDNDVHSNTAFLGLGTFGTGPGNNHGLTSPVPWPALNNNGGDIDLRILLDTSGGANVWTVTMLAKLPDDEDYTVIRPTSEVLNEANFTSVGIAFARGDTITGTIERFSLTASPAVPDAPFRLVITRNGPDFDFEWNSQPDKLYDLLTSTDLATPIADWPVHADGETLYEAIPSGGATTTLTAVASAGPRRFFAMRESDAPPFFFADFETDAAGFTVTTTGAGSTWQHGAPDSDDTGAGFDLKSGQGGSAGAMGVNLAGPYAAGTTTSLRSPVIDLGGLPEAAVVELRFARAIDMSDGDSLIVRVIAEDTDEPIGGEVLHTISGLTAADWGVIGPFKLPTEAIGRKVRVEWSFTGTDFGSNFLGSYIDDVEIRIN